MEIAPIEVPKANPENLLGIIREAYGGKVVIPEFQRSFLWAREDIEELLVSILQGYFIGTFLILDTSPERSLFPFRKIEGLDKIDPSVQSEKLPTVRLVLDGQQRITSLFYTLYEPPIRLRGAKYEHKFYFRLDLALDEDPSDAIVGVSTADRRRLAEMDDLTEAHMAIPIRLFRDSSVFFQWLYNEQKFLKSDDERKLIEGFYRRFADFMVPVVALSPEAGRDNIVNIFERINRTGISLSLFDLAVARLYLKKVKLREMWESFESENRDLAFLIKPEFLLKLVAMFEGREPKKSSLLDTIDALSEHEFSERWQKAVDYLIAAYKRVTSVASVGYGAVEARRWMPYTTMLVPLASLLAEVDERKGKEQLFRKVDTWYWACTFNQRYDQAVDTRTYQDVREVRGWMDGADRPAWIGGGVSPDRVDLEVDEPRSAIYRGVICLIVLCGAKDFLGGQPANLHECDDDHIFPKSKFGNYPHVNSILNRTLISKRTNEVKGNKKPSELLQLFLEAHGGDKQKLRETLRSHLISPDAEEAMMRDDFEGFTKARRSALLDELKKYVGH